MGVEFTAKSVILTNGTFLNGLIHIGKVQIGGGRISEPASVGMTEQLSDMGFKTDRMKTGTPVRIDSRSVDFSQLEEQAGENDFHKFSYLPNVKRELPQKSCWIGYTNTEVHEALREGLADSPLYNGQIKSIGQDIAQVLRQRLLLFPTKQATSYSWNRKE
jgi:tRNA uridine 5-carboxymethylaminomethyl modification enzyme